MHFNVNVVWNIKILIMAQLLQELFIADMFYVSFF